jgi:hypothetical protein
MGYENPDVVALLLLPPVDGSRTRLMPLGNTHAALKELYHFSSPGTTFQAKYHDREAPVQDSEPPFSRTVLLPLPDEGDEVGTGEVVEQCGQFLYRDMATPFGKVADLGRVGLSGPPWEQRGRYFQSFGLFHLAWPRHALVNEVSRRMCRQIVQRWLSKDSKPVRGPVQEWIQQQWAELELGADHFICAVQADIGRVLGQSPDSLFSTIVDSLQQESAGTSHEPGVNGAAGPGRGRPGLKLTVEQLSDVLQQFEELVGWPDDENPIQQPHLVQLLREATDRVVAAWNQKMVELPVRLIEEPAFRLAGAEESLRQLVATLEQVLQHHEPLAQDLARKASEAFEQLRNVLSLGRTSKVLPRGPEQVIELCRNYPRWRFQSLLLQYLASSFVGMRGHLSDELREVNFCRVRLNELLRLFEEAPEETLSPKQARDQGSIGRMLFVDDCRSLPEAVTHFMDGLTADHLLELDSRMEAMLQGSFTALVNVCLTNQNVLRQVEKNMLETAAAYASELLPAASVAGLFLDQNPDPTGAEGELADFYQQAGPELSQGRSPISGPPPLELSVLAAPADGDSEQLLAMLKEAMPQAEIQTAASAEDVLIYRERINLPLLGLEHMGALGQDAYTQMTSTDHFTPHTRTDVTF